MPIRDLLLDDSGDLAVVTGDLALAGGDTTTANVAAVQQAIAVRVRLFLAEYYLDQSIGVDWLGQILIKNPDPLVVRELLRAAIASTPDVTDVDAAQLIVDPATREGSIQYTVRTIYSTSPVSGEITSP